MGDYDYQVETLSNGLRLASLHLPHVHSVHVGAYVRAGSYYEDKSNNGVSHFLEHLHLATTTRHTTRFALGKVLDSLPGDVNGCTHEDMVQFSFDTAPDRLGHAGQLLSEILEIRDFDMETIEAERQLLLDEMASQPRYEIDEICCRRLFGFVPYGLAKGGTRKVLKRISPGQLHAFDERAFAPSNILVVVCGALMNGQCETVRRALERLPGTTGEPLDLAVAHACALPKVFGVFSTSRQRQVLMKFTLPSRPTADENTCMLVLTFALMSVSSRLLESLRYSVGANYHNYCFPSVVRDRGMFNVLGFVNGKQGDVLVREVLKECRRLKCGDISDEWLTNAKETYAYEVERVKDHPDRLALRIALAEPHRQYQAFGSIDQELDAVRRLDAPKLQQFAKSLFRPEHTCIATDAASFWPRRHRFLRYVKEFL